MQGENRQARRTECTKNENEQILGREEARWKQSHGEGVTHFFIWTTSTVTLHCVGPKHRTTQTVEFTLAVTCPVCNCVSDYIRLDIRLYI